MVNSINGHYEVDNEFINMVADFGLDEILLPFESRSNEMLQKYATGKYDPDKMLPFDIIKSIKRVNMNARSNFLIGFRDEPWESILKTKEFAKELFAEGIDQAGFSIPVPFPGTQDFEYEMRNPDIRKDFNENVIDSSLHYVFSKSKGYTDIISVRLDASLSPKASIQVYTEYYKNHYSYSDWRVLDDDNSSFPVTNELFFDGGTDSDGIVLPPLYFSSDDNSSGTYLTPNESPFFKADYRNLNLNCIFKWEYMPGANFYLVWVYQKNIAGEKFDSIIDFLNYDELENYNDIFENQSLHIKFDYWVNL